MNRKTTATVDGEKVIVDILESGTDIPGKGPVMPAWKFVLPLVLIGAAAVAVLLVSVTLFFWALPVLLPVALVFIIVRSLSGR